jgi:hypothetical protein
MFLTPAEVAQLTGRKYASAQRRALRRKGYPFEEDDAGRPLVLIATVERRIVGKATTPEPPPGPDFSAFPRLA